MKGFEKVALAPGESRDVTFTLDKRAFAYWNAALHDWHVESGEFTVEAGQSSRDIEASATVTVESTVQPPHRYTLDSIFMDIMDDPRAMAALQPVLEGINSMFGAGGGGESEVAKAAISEEMALAMLRYMPLRAVISFGGGAVSPEQLEGLLRLING